MRQYTYTLCNGEKINIKPPTLRQYSGLFTADALQLFEDIKSICGGREDLTAADCFGLQKGLCEWISKERDSDINLRVPFAPIQADEKVYFDCISSDIKIVSDYTRLNFGEVESLDIFKYYGYMHDTVVWNCRQTSEGRDYLEEAFLFGNTEPDIEGIRAFEERMAANGK